MKIALIGCGFLGSIWLEETAKRVYAAERGDTEFLLLDRDEFEARNAANQNFRPKTVRGDAYSNQKWLDWTPAKAQYLAQIAYAYGIEAVWHKADIIKQPELLDGADLIVDALDNLPARHAVWNQGMKHGTPILHMGINEFGTGEVEWTWATMQGWHLSPIKLGAQTIEPGEQPKHPPCHLVQMRGLGLNLGLAAAKATTLFMGEDIEEIFNESPQLPGYAVLTYWTATRQSHRMDKEKIHVKKEGQRFPEQEEEPDQGQEQHSQD